MYVSNMSSSTDIPNATLVKRGLCRILSLHVIGSVCQLLIFSVLWASSDSVEELHTYLGLTLFALASLIINIIIVTETFRAERVCTGCVYATILAQESNYQQALRPAPGYKLFLVLSLGSLCLSSLAAFLVLLALTPAYTVEETESWKALYLATMCFLASFPLMSGVMVAIQATVFRRKELCFRCKGQVSTNDHVESKRLLKDDINRNILDARVGETIEQSE